MGDGVSLSIPYLKRKVDFLFAIHNIESIVDLRLQFIQLQKVQFKSKALKTLIRKVPV